MPLLRQRPHLRLHRLSSQHLLRRLKLPSRHRLQKLLNQRQRRLPQRLHRLPRHKLKKKEVEEQQGGRQNLPPPHLHLLLKNLQRVPAEQPGVNAVLQNKRRQEIDGVAFCVTHELKKILIV
jgi:hypothetical protein